MYSYKMIFNDIELNKFIINYQVYECEIKKFNISELWANIGILILHLGYNVCQSLQEVKFTPQATNYFHVKTNLFPSFQFYELQTASVPLLSLSPLNITVILLKYALKLTDEYNSSFLAFIYGLSANFLTLADNNQQLSSTQIKDFMQQAENLYYRSDKNENIVMQKADTIFHIPIHFLLGVSIDFFKFLCIPSFIFKTEYFIVQTVSEGDQQYISDIKNGVLSNSSRSGKSVSLLSTYYYYYFSLRNTTIYIQCADKNSQPIYNNSSLNYSKALSLLFNSENYVHEDLKYQQIQANIREEIVQLYQLSQQFISQKIYLYSYNQLFVNSSSINFYQFYYRFQKNLDNFFNFTLFKIINYINKTKDSQTYFDNISIDEHEQILKYTLDHYIFNAHIIYPIESTYKQLKLDFQNNQNIQLINVKQIVFIFNVYQNTIFCNYFEQKQLILFDKIINKYILKLEGYVNWQDEQYLYSQNTFKLQLRTKQKQSLCNIVIKCNQFILTTKEVILKASQDTIVSAKDNQVLAKTHDESWSTQEISTLLNLFQQLLNICPDFADSNLLYDIQNILDSFKVEPNNLQFAIYLDNIIKVSKQNNTTLYSKNTIALIDYIVGYIREFIADNQQSLSTKTKAVVESQASKDILDRDESEAWENNKMSFIFALFVQLVVSYPYLQKFIQLYIQAVLNKSEQNDVNKFVLQGNSHLLLLVDEVLHQQNIIREKNQTNILNKYEQYFRLDNLLDYLQLLVQNSPSITHQRNLKRSTDHYTNLITENGKFHGLFLFIQELYNLRSIVSIFWRNISHYLQNKR
ncbi:hypothetical protein SS50377_21281 [Spironucleus salmonicida]|uniref:Uncharacterized protein n=1 Tax=Spironucleus salmonicida TaxID=348837 RepID=A0A9P8S2W1_9EUKA|nr:hypothetical protein SS50377_21281 [Spironucleus salmonicida]